MRKIETYYFNIKKKFVDDVFIKINKKLRTMRLIIINQLTESLR